MGTHFDELKANSKPNENGCWEWTAGKHAVGYGCCHAKYGGGRYAHRSMYIAARGEIPQGMYVLHKCDNRKCINPDHLFLGTHLENIKDMQAKGRHRGGSMPGESNPFCKFPESAIKAIRSAIAEGQRKRDIEREFNISETHYYRVAKGLRRAVEA